MIDKLNMQIINILMNSSSKLTSEKISSQTFTNLRTVRVRLREINELFKDNGAEITLKKGVGIDFQIVD